MIEILFRGKRKRDKKWGYGYLVKLGKESFSDPERYGIAEKGVPLMGSGVCYNFKIDEVILETVGQYTGFTDKNGTKIFEGDIIKILDKYIDTVIFAEGCFIMERQCYHYEFTYQDFDTFEVIGNIHDNPELLKGEYNA